MRKLKFAHSNTSDAVLFKAVCNCIFANKIQMKDITSMIY